MHKKVISLFSVEIFFVSQCRKISWGTLQCFGKFRVSKNFRHKRGGGGVFRSSVKKFSSHSTETFREGTLLCFRKLLVSKNFMNKRGEGEGVSRFSDGNFLSHSTGNLRRKNLSVSENFWYQKILCIRRGYHHFPSTFFCFTVPKNFAGESFLVSEKFWYRNFSCIFMHKRGAVSRFSVVKFRLKM